MKKTVSLLLLLSSLLIAGCMATKEIPLTEVPFISITDSVFQDLPELPKDLSQIKYIDIPLPTQENGNDPRNYPELTMDDIESYKAIQLEGLAKGDECRITNIQEDEGLLFVTLQKKNESSPYTLYGIFTMQGKLVAQLGEKIERNASPENDLQYEYAFGLQLDRVNKEVYIKHSGKLVYFDYKGNYRRTELPSFPSNHYTTRGVQVSFGTKKHQGIVFDKQRGPRAIAFKNDNRYFANFANKELLQIDDDLMNDYDYSDTLWQILPDRKVARYVYTGHATSPNDPETRNLPDKEYERAWANKVGKLKVLAGRNFVMTQLRVLREKRNWVTGYYHLYDSSSGHSKSWSGPISLDNKYFLYFPMASMLPDATLVYAESPYNIKMVHSRSLEKKIKCIITPEDSVFIRNLKLDGGPVLFFVKLKKF